MSGLTGRLSETTGLGYAAVAQRSLPAGPAFDPWRTWDADPAGTTDALLGAAVLAANARNEQPWRFAAAPERIDVYADSERRQGALDPFDREVHVGLGCAVENITLAAAAQGRVARVRLMPDSAQPTLAATLELAPAAASISPLYLAIPHRRTNRGPFQRRPLPPDLIAEMSALANDLTMASVCWFSAGEQRAAIGETLVAAARAIVADEEQSLDTHRWFRHSESEIQRERDGFTIDTQGLGSALVAVAKRLPRQPRSVADRFWLRQTSQVHVPTAAAFGMVTVPDAAQGSCRVEGGRLLQRLHLFATARGLAIGHLNMMTVRADRERQTGARPQFTEALAGFVGDRDREALVTFRIGYPVRPAGVSPRRGVSSVMISKSV
ncbi:MAG TPA: hypothetical protein VLL08_05330 [Kineosporiaceae bacterium]|nr:hypothetical protein [Kineosporiaceae bacterium]